MEADKETPWFFLLTHVFVVALAALQIVLCLQEEWGAGFSLQDYKSVTFFNFHPLFNILAFGVAMTEALISYRAFNLTHRTAKALHAFLQLASVMLGILAFTVVVLYHNNNQYPNFYSVHSWIGLTVYVLSWSQFLVGLLVFWLPGLAPSSLKATFLRLHKIGGVFIYFAAIAAVATGLMQKQSFLRDATPKAPLFGTANVLANATALLAVFTSLGVLGSLGFGRVGASRSAAASESAAGPEGPGAPAASYSSAGGLRTRTLSSNASRTRDNC